MRLSSSPPVRAPRPGGYFSEVFEAATYRHLLYFLVAGLLSLATVTALGLALLGAALSPLLLGVPLLLLGASLLGALARLDRWLGGQLLGVNLSRPTPVRPPGWWAWLRCRLTEANSYKVALYSVVKLPYMGFSTVWLGITLLGGLLLVGLPALLSAAPQLNLPLALGEQGYALTRSSILLLPFIGLGVMMLGISSLNLLARGWLTISYMLLTDYGENAPAVREVAALRAGAATVAFAGSLEATLTRLLHLSLSATSARSAHITVGKRTVSGGLSEAEPLPWPSPGTEERDTLRRIGNRQVLSFAVSPRGEALGTLRAVYDLAPSARETQFWAAVADQAASAADIARLIDQAQMQASEQERARLARELHDSVAQALYGVSLATRTARALIEKNPQRAAESLDFAQQLSDGASAEMKALLFALRPDALEEGGLAAALARLAEMLRLRYQLDVVLDASSEPALSREARGTLYRVAQEATHNAVKHARARQLRLSLKPEGAAWTLTVHDDGAGFDPALTRPGSLGLKSMRERAGLIGADLTLESRPGAGTTVRLSVPGTEPA